MPASGKRTISRREFGRSAVAATALAMLPAWSGRASAQEKSAPAQQPSPPVAPAAEAPSAEAEALAGIVKLRYGARLTEADLKDITKSLDGGLKTSVTLRKVPLENGDAPAFVFGAWRGKA